MVGGGFTQLLDPRTGEPVARIPVGTQAEVDVAVRSARLALESWRKTTPAARQSALLALADALHEQGRRFAVAEAQNTGKDPAYVQEEEISGAVDVLRFMAGAARTAQTPASGSYVEGFTSTVVREPVGVCALITPWNYPLGSAIDKLAPALAMGNTAVVKPAETTPLTTMLLGELCASILPPGVVGVVCGDRETGRRLVAHPDVDLISLTGSTRAGEEIVAAAGLRRLHLELGGNAPVIVLADADLESAAEGIVEAALFNAGQDCTAASRVLVAAEIHDIFVDRILERARTVEVGPLNNPEHLARVTGYVEDLPPHAQVRLGGTRAPGPGFHFAPTIVTHLRQDDAMIQGEVFGPVITVQPFSTLTEAMEMANDVPYGLAASIWTSDRGLAGRLGGQLDAGTIWINCHNVYATEMPHGGFKHSGYGKDLSTYALDTYTRIKHVMVAE